MGRLSTIEDAAVYGAVGALLAGKGAVTLQTIVAETGVSIGSLYHRYGSREGLLAQTWLDAVKSFQGGFLAALESGDADAGVRAALATPRFCRAERSRAIVLSCCRQAEFLSSATPVALRKEIRSVNDGAGAAIRRYARRSGYGLEACRLGLVAFPLGAVRIYLPNHRVPPAIDAYVVAAFRSAVGAK
jgi:AcrR family transcriptional regulator